MVKAKVFIFEKQFDGFPKESDIKLVEEELPPLQKGEFLAEAVFLSVDPYTRAYAPSLKLGKTCIGGQVAKIIESKNPKYPVGKHIFGYFGWRSHTISDGIPVGRAKEWDPPKLVPDFGDLPLSLAFGVLGMPGITAYFGFLEICSPKAGDTLVVTGAAGAIGSIVGQIAKLKGLNVIGITGSDEKGKWITEELGFDHFINYKTTDLDKALTELAPQGIDCYFDNVGGEQSSIILNHMNMFGRISVCGAISSYNEHGNKVLATPVQYPVLFRQLKMEGFVFNRWLDRWDEGIQQLLTWINEGKIKYKETITDGFENMFAAFTDVLNGRNFGKALVKV